MDEEKAQTGGKKREPHENDKLLPDENFENELDAFCKEMEVTDDTICGVWKLKGGCMQKLANKKVFILIYGLCGLMFSATYAYFSGTISTMEKRFKVTSKTMGIILVGNDITQLFVSIFLSYYAGKGHRPQWMALGMYSVSLFCFLCALPHFMYGPGEDSFALTLEYGPILQSNLTLDDNIENFGNEKLIHLKKDLLCNLEASVPDSCDKDLKDGSFVPVVIWFVAQLISGVGGTLYYTLGYAYIDDNIKKSKSPGVVSYTYFIRTIGPAVGYSLVSIFLKIYIAPTLTPTIDNTDPRWIGAWWMGWILMGFILIVLSTMLYAFPRELPRAAARRELIRQKSMEPKKDPEKPSFKGMSAAVKRLMTNSIFIYNQLSVIFFIFGYIPYWVYMPKYIETQYRQSASVSSLVTGSVGLVFSALGVLVAGVVIQKFKPRAKYLAFWNICITIATLIGMFEYSVLGCPDVDSSAAMIPTESNSSDAFCNLGCNCENIKFSPVCSVATRVTYISPCHAGCNQEYMDDKGTVMFGNCSCVSSSSENIFNGFIANSSSTGGGSVIQGQCAVDCQFYFYTFLATVCILKLIGSMGRTTTFLLTVRCVEERDKAFSLGIGLAAMSIFSLIPAPIFFGYIMDTTCIVWGKICGANGNCWLYNSALMRERINYIGILFMVGGIVFDVLIWWKIPDLNLYGETDGIIIVRKEEGVKEKESKSEIELDETKNI